MQRGLRIKESDGQMKNTILSSILGLTTLLCIGCKWGSETTKVKENEQPVDLALVSQHYKVTKNAQGITHVISTLCENNEM